MGDFPQLIIFLVFLKNGLQKNVVFFYWLITYLIDLYLCTFYVNTDKIPK